MGQYVTSESGCHLGSDTSDGVRSAGIDRTGDGLDTNLVEGAGLAAAILIAGGPNPASRALRTGSGTGGSGATP